MAILKSRPRVRVRVPTEIRPGDEIRATVVLDCKREIEVSGVDVRLEGQERWTVGSGDSSVTRRNAFLALAARLSEKRTFPKGRTELAVYIPLPADVPPSYRGAASRIAYTIEVHVAIPWWPDRRVSFDILVTPSEISSPESHPEIYSSNPSGPKSTEAHAEVSVACDWTRSGDIVNGALALSNVTQNRYTEVKVGLRGVETIYDAGKKRTEREYLRYQIRLGAEQAEEGEMIPFRFRLPPEAMPDLPWTQRPNGLPGLCSLAWQLEVIVGIRWGQDLVLRMPFRVLPASARPGDAPSRLAPPTVGSDRLRELWESVGTEHGLRYESQTLYGRRGGTTLAIRRDLMGRDGIFLIAELTYDDLQLLLDVSPATKVQMMVGGGARIGDPKWDRDHYVRARDEAQVAEVLGAIVPRMANATLRRMDDRRLTIAVRDTGVSPKRMQQFVAAATRLADEFEEVRADLPAPTPMREAVHAWRQLAGRMAGQLETARMRIEGQLGTMGAEVRLSFDDEGRPLNTWLSVTPPSPLDASHTLRVTGGDGAAAQLDARFDGETHELVRIIANGAHELSIEPTRVAVCLPTLLGVPADDAAQRHARALPTIEVGAAAAPATLTAAIAEQRLSRLARLVTVLRGQAGPYR